jgi:hypothetical protein
MVWKTKTWLGLGDVAMLDNNNVWWLVDWLIDWLIDRLVFNANISSISAISWDDWSK